MLNLSNLHNYQRNAVEHIKRLPFCALFMEMGLGKTVTTLTALSDLILDELEITKVLIVAPKRIAEHTWPAELGNWTHTKPLEATVIAGGPMQRRERLQEPTPIHIIGRDNLAWLIDELKAKHKGSPYDMLVLDELTSFKNTKTQRYKAVKALREYATRVVGLTGTPTPNGYIDLFAQMYLIDKGERLGQTKTKFLRSYFFPKVQNGFVTYKYDITEEKRKEIDDKIKDICVSMQAKDYLNLPRLMVIDYPTPITEKELKRYKEFQRHAVLDLEGQEVTAVTAGVLCNKLQQYSGGAIYTEEGAVVEVHTAKVEALTELIEASTTPVLVAYTFRHERDRIIKALKDFSPLEFNTAKDIAEWNKGQHHVAIGHPASIGHGLNIQHGGNTIIWFSLPYSLELYQQFNARLYRQGQTKPVTIYRLITPHTIDEKVAQVLEGKTTIQQAIMDNLKNYNNANNL